MQQNSLEAILGQLRLPVIQAPMAGGPCTVDFVASVIAEGLIGSFGFAYSSADTIKAELAALRSRTNGPVNANFFIFEALEAPSIEEVQQALQALDSLSFFKEDRFKREATISLLQQSASRAITAPFFPSLKDQVEAVWEFRPELLSFHFGPPPQWVFEQARQLHVPILVSATCPSDAQEIEHLGASAIVAQGIEAGGHQAYFDHRLAELPSPSISTLELVRSIKRHCQIPVIAAGGIMNGADIHEALQAGASAVQMGTAFLACDESGASPEHKHLLTSQAQRGTVLTRAFSGRFARGLRNEFTEGMQQQPILPFPLQNILTAALRQQSAKNADGEFQSLWAGAAYGQCRAEPVRNLVSRLFEQFQARS